MARANQIGLRTSTDRNHRSKSSAFTRVIPVAGTISHILPPLSIPMITGRCSILGILDFRKFFAEPSGRDRGHNQGGRCGWVQDGLCTARAIKCVCNFAMAFFSLHKCRLPADRVTFCPLWYLLPGTLRRSRRGRSTFSTSLQLNQWNSLVAFV